MSSAVQPPWTAPKNESPAPVLRVRNSLVTAEPTVEFTPRSGKTVTWYTCGPTVYDLSHLGHARNYVGFDIVRRIMQDYFQYHVFQVMNITDIDDKIIKRANESGREFNDLARQFEDEFMKDMTALGVRPPDALTRVSEYVPEIIAYVQRIISNGFAYETKGSVYFDVDAFTAAGHHYGRLEPSSVGNQALIAEGEGALSQDLGVKKSRADFALWKASKEGEPFWDSPWGKGRPGWHIECSAMASALLGSPIDVHSGGVDLKFPHHDNELAQAEGYHKDMQWVNYFLHAGHLHIDGLKMSKSLKNFKTIQEALTKFKPREIRWLFVAQKYNEPMYYGDNSMDEMCAVDKKFVEFFHNVRSTLRAADSRASAKWSERDTVAFENFRHAEKAVDAALCADFDTPKVLSIFQDLIRDTNKYIAEGSASTFVIRTIAIYINRILTVFGLTGDDLSFGAIAGGSDDQTLIGVLDTFAAYRDEVRAAAQAKDCDAVLKATDVVRNVSLPVHGIRLEDGKPGAPSTWKREDPEVLRKDAERKQLLAAEKAEKAKIARELEAKKAAEKAEKAKIPPAMLFQTPEYSQWDPLGIPTHDKDGKELSKSAQKTVKKAWEAQDALHKKFLATPTSS